MKLRVSYADVAVGAKENFAPSATGQTSNSTPALLQGQQTPMYANPCEIYSVLLDGSLMVPPDDPKYALVSDSLSSATARPHAHRDRAVHLARNHACF